MQNSQLKLTQISQFSSANVNANGRGKMQTVPAGTTVSIDLKMTDDCFITGGVLRTDAATFGDKATFQVIDIDNILGYGENKILGTYLTDWYMRSDAQQQLDENLYYPAKILANLYLRVIYASVGNTDVQVAVNYRLHKALY
jgi:hypothetical protein